MVACCSVSGILPELVGCFRCFAPKAVEKGSGCFRKRSEATGGFAKSVSVCCFMLSVLAHRRNPAKRKSRRLLLNHVGLRMGAVLCIRCEDRELVVIFSADALETKGISGWSESRCKVMSASVTANFAEQFRVCGNQSLSDLRNASALLSAFSIFTKIHALK